MEIRTRKVVHTRAYGDGRKPCKRGAFYRIRHVQPNCSEEIHSPTYRIIETREPLRRKASLDTLWRRESTPIRSRPFKMSIPFIRRISTHEDDDSDSEPSPRGRGRSPRLFVVDSTQDVCYDWSRSDSSRSPSPQIRCISPRARRFSRSSTTEKETVVVSGDAPRKARSLERPFGRRPPRERTPIFEREPSRRRPYRSSNNTVEVHISPDRDGERSRSSGRRHVRFSQEVDYEEDRSRAREQRYEPRTTRIREIFNRRTEAISPIYMPRIRQISPDRTQCHRAGSPWPRHMADIPRSSTTWGGRRLRPRIIQDGNREISEACERIYAAARRKRSSESFSRDFTLHSSSRRRSRSDRIRDFDSEYESTFRDRKFERYRWRRR